MEPAKERNIVRASLTGIALLIVGYFTSFLLTDYLTPYGRYNLPFVVFVVDTINLFIHEGGHGVFGIFGTFVGFLGGSLMQVLIPLATVIVFFKSGFRSLIFTLYWLGHNLINVSIYIADAPYRKLRLISKHAIHDWGWICDKLGITHHAESIATVVLVIGGATCIAALGVGLFAIYRDLSPAPATRNKRFSNP
ncbi:MAG: hypothetical protein FJ215_05800 [Ignavibacteria bacterium]|nr:hypothetical protein [Ignavibacteria bacterium]